MLYIKCSQFRPLEWVSIVAPRPISVPLKTFRISATLAHFFFMSSFSGFGFEARALGRTVRAALVLLVTILSPSTGAKLLHSQEGQEPGRVDGKVCAVSGKPIAGALVTLVGKGSARRIETRTNVDGTFVLPESGEGTYTLHAEKAG